MKPQDDPKRHHRRSIRLPEYDYASPGAYFVTVCVRKGECLLGRVADGEMQRSEYGQLAHDFWKQVRVHFPSVAVDAFVIMPNHLHVIVMIHETSVRAGDEMGEVTSPLQASDEGQRGRGAVSAPSGQTQPTSGIKRPTLGQIIAYYKYMTTKQINLMRGTPGIPFWQRNYWEHVIRTDQALNAIRQYVTDNPTRWPWDTYNPAATGRDPRAIELWRLLQEEAK
jgi:REP element-mobilizing transposase RayT